MLQILLLLLVTGQATPEPVRVELAELGFLAGDWLGELEYLDYGDDRTRVVLPVRAKFVETETGFNFEFAVEEPGGQEALNRGTLEVADGGKALIFDGERLTAIAEKSGPETQNYSLTLDSRGQDNGRPAAYRTILRFEDGELFFTRRATLDEDGRSFVRNEYRLRRAVSPKIGNEVDPRKLLGTWVVDLRPAPNAPPHEIEFRVDGVQDETIEGVFYGSPIEAGRINAKWGEVRFGFVTRDGSGPYYTSGVMGDGELTGTTHSIGRGFLSVWRAVRKSDATEQ